MPRAGYMGLFIFTGLVGSALALFTMVSVNPLQIGPYGVTVWFLIVFAGLTGIFSAVFYWLANKLNKKPIRPRAYPALRRGALLSVWLTILLGLSSLRQLGWRDVLLTAILLALAEFYFEAKG